MSTREHTVGARIPVERPAPARPWGAQRLRQRPRPRPALSILGGPLPLVLVRTCRLPWPCPLLAASLLSPLGTIAAQ